jgi:hypothetical protein
MHKSTQIYLHIENILKVPSSLKIGLIIPVPEIWAELDNVTFFQTFFKDYFH